MTDPYDQDPYDEPDAPPPAGDPPPSSAAPAPASSHPYPPPGMTCHHCGADLSGAMLGGNCPACGAPITSSYYASHQSAGMAISSMILGIVSVVSALPAFCCACLSGVSVICGVLAVIFYFPAMNAVKNENAPPNSAKMALAGLICGIIGLLISIGGIGFFVIFGLMNP